MVKYSPYLWSFHLQQGLFVTFDVYLSYLSDRSHFMVPLRAVTSVRLPENIFRSNQNNLILLYGCTWKQRSQHRGGRWCSIDLFYCHSNFVSGKWLWPSPKVKMVTVGNSTRDFGTEDSCEQYQRATFKFVNFPLLKHCWAFPTQTLYCAGCWLRSNTGHLGSSGYFLFVV